MTHQPPAAHLVHNPYDSIASRLSLTCLPPHVLSHIFLLYVALLDEPLSVTLPAQGPFCLAQVCSRWRTIAESDPHLWSSIHLSIPDSFEEYKNGTQRVRLVFDLYLKRSGTLPISLTYIDSDYHHSAQEKLVSLLVHQLRTHSRRWKRISLDLSSNYFPHLSTFTSCDLSSLEHLSLIGFTFREGLTSARLDLECAKNLKSFAYCGYEDSLVEEISLRWEQLEEVSLQLPGRAGFDGMSYGHFECLALCQNITTCSLHARVGYTHSEINWRTITLPCLRTLRVRLESTLRNVDRIINFLILPQLQTLEIGPESTSRYAFPLLEESKFSDLLKRSNCALRHLSIQDVNLPSDDILCCLKLSDTLLSFSYVPDPLSQDAFGDLVCNLRALPLVVMEQMKIRKPLVPELREITLGTSVQAYMDTMIAVFRSRGGACAHAAGISPLQRVRAVFLCAGHQFAHHLTMPSVEATCLRKELAEWESEMEDERKNGGEVLRERLETWVDAFAICKSSGQRYRYPRTTTWQNE